MPKQAKLELIDSSTVSLNVQSFVHSVVDPVSSNVGHIRSQNNLIYINLSEVHRAFADKLAAVLNHRLNSLMLIATGQFAPYNPDIHKAEFLHETWHLGTFFLHQMNTSSHYLVACFTQMTPLISIAAGIFKVVKSEILINEAKAITGILGQQFTPDVMTSLIKNLTYRLVDHYQGALKNGWPQFSKVRINTISGRNALEVWLHILVLQTLESLKEITNNIDNNPDIFVNSLFDHITKQIHSVGDLIMPNDALPIYSKEYSKEELRIVLEVRKILFEDQVSPSASAATTPKNLNAVTLYLQAILDTLLPDRESSATSPIWWLMGYSGKGINALRELHIRLINVIRYTGKESQKQSIPDLIRNMIDSLVQDYLIEKAQDHSFEYHRGLHRVLIDHVNAIARLEIDSTHEGHFFVKYRDSTNALSMVEELQEEAERYKNKYVNGQAQFEDIMLSVQDLKEKFLERTYRTSQNNSPVVESFEAVSTVKSTRTSLIKSSFEFVQSENIHGTFSARRSPSHREDDLQLSPSELTELKSIGT